MKNIFYRERNPYRIVLIWGITVALASALTQIEQMMILDLPGTASGRVMVYWTLLMLPPIIGTWEEYRALGDRKHLNVIWSVLVIVLMIFTWATLLTGMSGFQAILSYFHKWFFVPAALFVYSAWKLAGTGRTVYIAAAIGNLGITAALILDPTAITWAYAAGIPLQGLPMVADWYLNR